MKRWWRSWKYKHLTSLGLGLVLAFFLLQNEVFHTFIRGLHQYGYLGALIAGLAFSSMFTVAPSIIAFIYLSEIMPPLELAIIGGLGAVLGDIIILHVLDGGLMDELQFIYKKWRLRWRLQWNFRSPYLRWMLPCIGALIIVSPLPDELGVSLMGISHMRSPVFFLISFCMNALGIFLITILPKVV